MQKSKSDLNLGGNIRKLRIRSGMTQEQVVAKLQVMGLPISRSSYAKIETNLLNIRVSELVGLKNIFKCRFDDFFEGLEPEDNQ